VILLLKFVNQFLVAKSAKEIWDYLNCLYATNGKVSDFDMIEQEDTVEIKEFVDYKVGNDIDPWEKQDEIINANTKIQNVKDHGHLQTGYNDKSGPQRVLS